MRVLLVADQQNSFPTYKYARKLTRRLEKVGVKAAVFTEDFKDSLEFLREKQPDILHIHYHPEARKLRQVMLAADELGIPFIVTYHKVAHMEEGRRSHLKKCLERTRRAYFLTQPDWGAACVINPRLKEQGALLNMPGPGDMPHEWAQAREALLDSFFITKKPKATILYYGDIAPDNGLEAALELSRSFKKGMELRIAGTVPAGGGSYVKYMKAKAKYEKLPVSWYVSKRAPGTKQLADQAADCLFAYLPCGEQQGEGYGGASLHSMMIPLFNRMRVRIFSHVGLDTTTEIEQQVHVLNDPGELRDAIAAYHASPSTLYEALRVAEEVATKTSWPDLAKQMMMGYKEVIAAAASRMPPQVA